MKALSVRAPWWWFILHGEKDIENRSTHFPRSVRGRVWLHCGKWWNDEDVECDALDAQSMYEKVHDHCIGVLEGWGELREYCGCIVGSVEIVDYVTKSNSPWFVGDVGLVLRNPIPLSTPVPFKGMLGFFEVPDSFIQFK